MNPVQAIMNAFGSAVTGPVQMGQFAQSPTAQPANPVQMAQQLAQAFRNPQALVQCFFPDAPVGIQSDPDQLLAWLQQTGKVNHQMVQVARQMVGR